MTINDRDKISLRCGTTGIILNIFLSIGKILIGILNSSISILADGLNNFSDAGSSIVTIVGTKISQKPVDKEHPYGHGRFEYVAALIVTIIILFMGFALGRVSVMKIFYPEEIKVSVWNYIIPGLSIFIKLIMVLYNHIGYKKTDNINLKAVRQDSLMDILATAATIIAVLITNFTSFKRADGITGLLVCFLVLSSGLSLFKEVLDPLLGKAPSKELVSKIYEILLEEKIIVGVHDLIIHDYGPRKVFASAHVEVSDMLNIKTIHERVDAAEKKILKNLNVDITLHMDPVALNDKKYINYKNLAEKIIQKYDKDFRFHDFKTIKKQNENVVFVFDLVLPFEQKKYDSEKIKKDLEELFKKEDEKISLDINVEHSYV